MIGDKDTKIVSKELKRDGEPNNRNRHSSVIKMNFIIIADRDIEDELEEVSLILSQRVHSDKFHVVAAEIDGMTTDEDQEETIRLTERSITRAHEEFLDKREETVEMMHDLVENIFGGKSTRH